MYDTDTIFSTISSRGYSVNSRVVRGCVELTAWRTRGEQTDRSSVISLGPLAAVNDAASRLASQLGIRLEHLGDPQVNPLKHVIAG